MTPPGRAIHHTPFTLLLWIGSVHALPTPQQQVDADTTEATSGASASATSVTSSMSGISNVELIGYAAAGIAVLLAIAVGGIMWNKRRKRKTAVAAESEPSQGTLPRKESFDSSVDEDPRAVSHEPATPVVSQNLAGRGVQANRRVLNHQPVPAKISRKLKRGEGVQQSSDEEESTVRPRRERRAQKKIHNHKRRGQNESSDSETESCTDESVRNTRR